MTNTKTAILAALSLIAFVFVANPLLRIVLLGAAICIAIPRMRWPAAHLATIAVISWTYAAAFLLNPIAVFVRRVAVEQGAATTTALIQWGFGVIGFIWLWQCSRNARSLACRRMLPGGAISLACIVGCVVVYGASWMADVAYRGDESYHFSSVHMAYLLMCAVGEHRWGVIVTGGWLLIGMVLACRHCPVERASMTHWWPALYWAAAGVLLAALVSPSLYPPEILEQGFGQGRITRYPAAQYWWTALIGASSVRYWGQPALFHNETMRALPIISLCILSVILAGDRRWRRVAPRGYAALAAMAIVTIPTFLYHGTILYLELPAVVLLCVVAFDGRAWLTRPAERVVRRPSWWALILLSFTKETVLPLLLVALGFRVVWQCFLTPPKPRPRLIGRRLASEVRIIGCVLLPIAGYLAFRSLNESRPYGAHFAQLLDWTLWVHNARALVYQAGLLVVFAVAGAAILWRRRDWALLTLCIGLFVGQQAFFLADSAGYVGLARFNLLLLPPIIVLAWTTLTTLVQRERSMGLCAVVVLLLGNLWLSPVNRYGERSAWGQSDDRWYPFTAVFSRLRTEAPTTSVLLGNMHSPLAVGYVCNRAGWTPGRIEQVRLIANEHNLERTLDFAAAQGFDDIIYRYEDTPPISSNRFRYSDYRLVNDYSARAGGLLLLTRRTP